MNYAAIAKLAPKKKKYPRPNRKKKIAAKPEKKVFRFTPPTNYSPKPEGVQRYYLKVPHYKTKQARDAGCGFDGRYWYIDNPKLLEDFAAWKPTLRTRP